MKIKDLLDGTIYHLPISGKTTILAANEYKNHITEALSFYFEQKKKNKITILDENDEVINNKDYEFIYIPYSKDIDSNFTFKNKSILNNEITEIIEENPKMFLTVDLIREQLKNLLTDVGMYKVRSILSAEIQNNIEIEINEFSISNLLQMFQIKTDNMSESQKYMIVYNLLFHVKRNKEILVYIDFPFDKEVLNWINNSTQNIHFIIDNESIVFNDISYLKECNLIRLSNNDFIEEYEFNCCLLPSIVYLFHFYIMQNINYQKDEIIRLYSLFSDKNATYLVKFSNSNLNNIL